MINGLAFFVSIFRQIRENIEEKINERNIKNVSRKCSLQIATCRVSMTSIISLQPIKNIIEIFQKKYFLAAVMPLSSRECLASFYKHKKQNYLKSEYLRWNFIFAVQHEAAGINVFCRPAANFLKAIISLSLYRYMRSTISQLGLSQVANLKIVGSSRRI